MVRCNCAALAPGLLESELFGHVKGAFTGAVRDRKGRFEDADGGTLFLDEIGDLPADTQIRLLRVLQEREFEPVGSTETRKVDVRLITATHKDLETEMQQGRWRQDLFYRINTVVIDVPALRERRSDIPLLCAHFLRAQNSLLQKEVKGFTAEALNLLETYEWPGNVRQLENTIMRATALSRGDEIGVEQLAVEIPGTNGKVAPSNGTAYFGISARLFHRAREEFEAIFIERVLRETRGNITQAASRMDLGRRNLQRKINQYQIDVHRFEGEHPRDGRPH